MFSALTLNLYFLPSFRPLTGIVVPDPNPVTFSQVEEPSSCFSTTYPVVSLKNYEKLHVSGKERIWPLYSNCVLFFKERMRGREKKGRQREGEGNGFFCLFKFQNGFISLACLRHCRVIYKTKSTCNFRSPIVYWWFPGEFAGIGHHIRDL